jgi:hypothetical protein
VSLDAATFCLISVAEIGLFLVDFDLFCRAGGFWTAWQLLADWSSVFLGISAADKSEFAP